MLSAPAVALRNPDRIGRQLIKGEIWPERRLFALILMFKRAGARYNVISTVYQGKGWTGEAIEPHSPLHSCQRIPIVTPPPPHYLNGEKGQLGLGSLAVISVRSIRVHTRIKTHKTPVYCTERP